MTRSRLNELLEAERRVRWSDARVGSNWNALGAHIRSGRKALPIALGPLALGLYPMIAKAGVVILTVGLSAATTVAVYRTTEPSLSPVQQSPTAVAGRPRPAVVARPSMQPVSVPSASAPVEHPVVATTPTSTQVADRTDTLEQELVLLRKAKQLLSEQDFEGARLALEQHRLRFPSGMVGLERQALELIVACSTGKTQRAKQNARGYLASNPRSIHAPAIARTCEVGLPAPSPSQSPTQAFPVEE